MAKYMFLQYVDESKAPRPGTPELDQQIEAFAKYLEEVQSAGVFVNGDPCQQSAAGREGWHRRGSPDPVPDVAPLTQPFGHGWSYRSPGSCHSCPNGR